MSCKEINAECPNSGCGQNEGLNTLSKLQEHILSCNKTVSRCKTCNREVSRDEFAFHTAQCYDALIDRNEKANWLLEAENQRIQTENEKLLTETERLRAQLKLANL